MIFFFFQALIRPVFQDTAAHTQLMAMTLKDPAAHRGVPRKGDAHDILTYTNTCVRVMHANIVTHLRT